MSRSRTFLLLLSLLGTSAVEAERLFGVGAGVGGWEVFWFDSEAPGELLGQLPLHGVFDNYLSIRIEFDPITDELYGFGYPSCEITCPPSPVFPARIDLATGETTFLDWPGFPAFQLGTHDIRIDPATRELRAIWAPNNYRYSLDELELHVDEDLTLTGQYDAIAHAPPGGPHGGETLALFRPRTGGTTTHLVRIGGVGGNPPASSGVVTLLGEIQRANFVWSLDITPSGTAYVLGGAAPFGKARLYRLDLDTLETEDLGEVATGASDPYVEGLAAAPPGFGQTVLEVPALRGWSAIVLSLLLASLAVYRLHPR